MLTNDYKERVKKLYSLMKARNWNDNFIKVVLAYYITYGSAFRYTVDTWAEAENINDISLYEKEIMEVVTFYKTEGSRIH